MTKQELANPYIHGTPAQWYLKAKEEAEEEYLTVSEASLTPANHSSHVYWLSRQET